MERSLYLQYDSTGYLQIRAFVAGGAFPIDGVSVRIIGNEENNVGINYSLLTGRDGKTEMLPLPAPNITFSLAPNAKEQPYSNYDVEIYKDGYYPKKILNVPIFAGTKSILPMELIPDGGIKINVSAPLSSNFSVIYENEELE